MPVSRSQTLQRNDSLSDQVMGTRFDDPEAQEGEILEHHLETKLLVPNRIQRVVLYHFRFMLRTIDRDAHQLDLDVGAGDEVRRGYVLAGDDRERQVCRM